MRALETDLAACQGSLLSVENKISITRSSYDKPLRRAAEKRERIGAERAEAEAEVCVLRVTSAHSEQHVTNHCERMDQIVFLPLEHKQVLVESYGDMYYR